MSRSIHHTVKSVFGGKSAREIDAMVESADPDVVELVRKSQYKRKAREERQQREGRQEAEEA